VHSKVKAFASVSFDGAFVVYGLRVMESARGLFVAMPSTTYTDKSGKTQYSDIFHAVTRQAHDAIQQSVLNAYQQAIQQMQTNQFEYVPEPPPMPDWG